MNSYITHFICGFIAFNENKKIIDYRLFPNNEIISNYIKTENNELSDSEISLIESLKNDYDTISIETLNRLSTYSNYDNVKIENPNIAGEYLRSNFDEVIKKLNLSKEEVLSNYKKLAIYKMKEISKSDDKYLIQAINSIDEIDEGISKLIERIREWYSLYIPEMELINNNEKYIKLIALNKSKKEIMKKNKDVFPLDIEEFYEDEIDKDDLSIMNEFANSLYSLQKTRKNIEKYIENKMEKIAPNLKILVGSTLGAKLIAYAGGIKRLAMYPSSTVQIMGAEKALFRHLKTGENPPKHGIIYQHPQVRGSKWWNRGKIARALSLKISLAIRKDYFSDDVDLEIGENFLKKVEKIEKENPFPPAKSERRKKKKNKNRRR